MKHTKIIILVLALFLALKLNAQTGIGTKNVTNGVMLQLESTNKGLLIPSYELTSKTVTTPLSANIPFGTLVFNTATKGAFPNIIIPGLYWWNSQEKQWYNVANSLDSAVMKYVNNEVSTNYNTTNWQNLKIFGNRIFNESSVIYDVNSSNNTVKIGRSGLYSISTLISLDRLVGARQGRVSLTARIFVNDQPVGTEQVFSPGYTSSISRGRGLFTHSFTEYLEFKDNDVVSVKIKQTTGTYSNNYGTSGVNFLTSGDSSISFLRIR